MTICDKCKATKGVRYVQVSMEVTGDGDSAIVLDYALDLCAACRTIQKRLVGKSKVTADTKGRGR